MNKARFVAGLLALGVTALSAMPTLAATHDGRAKILLHIKNVTTKNVCTTYGATNGAATGTPITDCSAAGQINTQGNLVPIGGPGYSFIYLLVSKGALPSIAGLQCGIYYQGGNAGEDGDFTQIDVFAWQLCAALDFPTPLPANVWPKPGGGNLITWDGVNNCQTGEIAVAGYFYAAAYNVPGAVDYMSITKRPVDMAAKVANCQNAETLLEVGDLGFAAFSNGATTEGCNPCMETCIPVATETTTWGGIKSLFNH